MSDNKQNILVLGDLHISEKRKRSIAIAFKSIFSSIPKNTKFLYVVLLGDIFNKYPTITERVIFANIVKKLYKYTKKIVFIGGTDSHDYSNGIFNLSDLLILKPKSLVFEKRFKFNNFLFVHEPIKGAKYDNGIEEKTGLDISKIKETVIAGHFHTPQEKENLIILGSVYKTTFAQKDNIKRILFINENKLSFTNIKSMPMYEIDLIGKKGKVKCPQINLLNAMEKGVYIDLKINVITDSQTLPSIHSSISKIKSEFNIEYYQQNIEIKRLKIKTPKSLNEKELLKEYAKENYNLALKELQK